MAKTSKGKEIILVIPNKVGTLARVSSVIAGAGVNINAILARGEKSKAYFHIVVDRLMKAMNVLKKANYKVTNEDVILLEMANKPGEMEKVADKIAGAGIDIKYVYGSVGGGKSFCVLKTDNDKKAMKVAGGK